MQTYRPLETTMAIPIIEGEVYLACSLAGLEQAVTMLNYKCTQNIYIVKGCVHWSSGEESTNLSEGDIIIHNMENSHGKFISENGLEIFAMCVSSNFTRQFSQSIKVSWHVRQALISNALFHLSSEDRQLVCDNYDFLFRKCQGSDYPERDRILKQMLFTLSVEILIKLNRYILDPECPKRNEGQNRNSGISIGSSTSAQVIYNRFVNMLESLPVKNRPVAYWASMLNITPKYLSAVCREVEGRSARCLISDSVIHEAVELLRNQSLSIKEISDRLGFVNQSHFGTFFKKHTGHSPNKDERKG